MGKLTRREAIGVFGAAAVVGMPAAQAQTGPAALAFEAEALAWLRRTARPLADHEPTPDALRPLVQALDGAQVIGVGEATNGSHEDQACKAAIIRALIAHGDVRVLAVEGNRRAASRFDEYVRGGGPDPVATLREGGFFQAWQTEPFAALIAWIRAWNLSGRPIVRIIGVDVTSSGSDAYEAFNFVQVNAPRFAVNFERPLAPLIASPEARARSVLETAQRLSPDQWRAAREALNQLLIHIQGSTRPGAERAARAAASARRAMDLARNAAASAAEGQRVDATMAAQRERLMAENLLEQAGSDRTVLWAHNLNVMGTGGTASHLRRRLANRYRAVAFEYERGTIRTKPGIGAAPPPDTVPWQMSERPANPLGLGTFLGQVGPDHFWVPLTAAAEAAPEAFVSHPFGHDWPQLGAASPDGGLPLRRSVDILVFLRALTPSRLYPFVPQG